TSPTPERSSVPHDATDVLLDRLLASDPPLRLSLARARDAASDAVEQRLLDLATARAALLLGVDAGPESVSPAGDDRERACVALVDQMVIDVTGVDDVLVQRVADHLGDDGAATFVAATLVVEQRIRLRAMWHHLGLAP
ncbi:MAG: hypothetical protein KDB37_21885, partial [Ilumatobacter sp.]|nr:hypothetical protein [Ilumatobacter sp.]